MIRDWFRRVPEPEPEAVPVRPRRIGLALGGGAVRGAAHVGVLSVLEREGIRPEVVSGVSAGAIVGAGVAAGVPSAAILDAIRKATWLRFAVPAWHSHLSMLDSSPLSGLIEQITRVGEIEALDLPFAAVACDLLTGRRVVMTSGPLREAVMASSALPGLFEPVRRGADLLVDGQVLENIPSQAARDLGADYVIGVDVMPPPVDSAEPSEARQVLLMAWDIVQRQQACPSPDLVVTPAVGAISPWDFTRIPEAYAAGVAAMEAALPRLRADLGIERDAPSR